jgi:hypothetical protein
MKILFYNQWIDVIRKDRVSSFTLLNIDFVELFGDFEISLYLLGFGIHIII